MKQVTFKYALKLLMRMLASFFSVSFVLSFTHTTHLGLD